MSEIDIVERLREVENVEREIAHDCDCPPKATANWKYAETCATAADEITRLRAEVEKLRTKAAKADEAIARQQLDLEEAADRAADCDILRAKVERLRAALKVWQNAYKTGRNEPLVQAYEHSTALGDTHE